MKRDPLIPATILALLLVVAGLVGYKIHSDNSRPTSGTVTAKHHADGYYYSSSCGKSTCLNHVPESWSITISDGQRTGDWDLEQPEWELVKVGDLWQVRR